MLRATQSGYFPAWTEFAITAGVISAAVLVFMFAVEHFNVWEARPRDEEYETHSRPQFEPGTNVWLGTPGIADRARCSLAFIFAAAVALSFLSFDSSAKTGKISTLAQRSLGREDMVIDGNRDAFLVHFDHKGHVERNGGENSCRMCHHMNLPHDKASACADCHSQMYLPTSFFHHWQHAEKLGGNASCAECHTDSHDRRLATTKTCAECHVDSLTMTAAGSADLWDGEQPEVVSYTDAMHGLCVTCHKQTAEEVGNVHHADCATCHRPIEDSPDMAEMERRWLEHAQTRSASRGVIMPRPLSKDVDFLALRGE
jgi:hypothetical protein